MSTLTRQSHPRVDGAAKVSGAAEYAGDMRVPGMLHAALVLSSIARGNVQCIETDAAEQVEGIAAILTHENAERVVPGPYRTWLQDSNVVHAGQPVALVLAETLAAARETARLVTVRYASVPPLPRLPDPDATPKVAPEIYGKPAESLRGNLGEGRAKSDVTVEAEYVTPPHCHNPIERGIALAQWHAGKVLVQTATSGIFAARRTIAQAFGIEEKAVIVQMPFQGGGFGAKGSAWWPSLILAVAASRQAGRPVRLELSREDMFSALGRRAPTRQHLVIGADAQGRLAFMDHLAIQETSPLADYSDPTCFATRSVYSCPNVRTRHMLVTANTPQPNAMRAPGETPGSFALECAIDELCHRLGMDPIAFRLANIADRDDDAGLEWSSNGLRACLVEGSKRFGWVPRVPRTKASADHCGQGVAAAYYPVFQAGAAATLRLDRQGRVTLFCGNQDIGNGSSTVMCEVAGGELGVDVSDISLEYGDTRLPETPMAAGSMSTASVIPAIQGAAEALKAKFVRAACRERGSPFYGEVERDVFWNSPAQITLQGSSITVGAVELLRLAAAPYWEATYTALPADTGFSSSAFGACFARVNVDLELGTVRLMNVCGVYTAGRILNRRLAESQLIGGIVMGIGAALMEGVEDDHFTGLPLNRSLGSYLLPTNADIPRLDVHLLEEHDLNGSTGGIKGLGMIGSVGVTAAIANAMFDATGLRIHELPMSLDKLVTHEERGAEGMEH